jgi:hypothetical protein
MFGAKKEIKLMPSRKNTQKSFFKRLIIGLHLFYENGANEDRTKNDTAAKVEFEKAANYLGYNSYEKLVDMRILNNLFSDLNSRLDEDDAYLNTNITPSDSENPDDNTTQLLNDNSAEEEWSDLSSKPEEDPVNVMSGDIRDDDSSNSIFEDELPTPSLEQSGNKSNDGKKHRKKNHKRHIK